MQRESTTLRTFSGTRSCCALLALACSASATAQDTLSGLAYAQVDGTTLRLDLYRPAPGPVPLPLVIWVYGGGSRQIARTPRARRDRPRPTT
jgi:poly(3-hydroxybutyrate) depolymerase